jgi:hypothetical protein
LVVSVFIDGSRKSSKSKVRLGFNHIDKVDFLRLSYGASEGSSFFGILKPVLLAVGIVSLVLREYSIMENLSSGSRPRKTRDGKFTSSST